MTSVGLLIFSVVAFGAIAAFPLWLMVRGVRRGVWNGRGVDVFRSDRPLAFWFGIVMYGVIAAIILTFPLYVLWDTFMRR
jgi:hypothetical protein